MQKILIIVAVQSRNQQWNGSVKSQPYKCKMKKRKKIEDLYLILKGFQIRNDLVSLH